MIRQPLLIAATLALASCATTPPPHPESRPFTAAPSPTAEVDAAFARAAAANKRVILIFGSDACHDSRGLAGWFATARFQQMLQPRYEIVWIDVGAAMDRQPGAARRFGLHPIVGTPTVLIAAADGTPLNADDAAGWRNASTRSEAEIYAYFLRWGSDAG